MVLNQALLREARQARDRLIGLQHESELAQVSYQHTIRRLYVQEGRCGRSVTREANLHRGEGAFPTASPRRLCPRRGVPVAKPTHPPRTKREGAPGLRPTAPECTGHFDSSRGGATVRMRFHR
jgi:hypothetical protein